MVSNLQFIFLLWMLLRLGGCADSPKNNGQGTQVGDEPVKVLSGEISFPIPAHFSGFNTQMMRGPSWRDEGFIKQVKGLSPGLIRYPGGTVASYWEWQTGWLKSGIQPRPAWRNIKKRNPIQLTDLKYACDQTGGIPLFVLNMMTSTIEDQLKLLTEAVNMGMPVKYVELDNELYLGEKFYAGKFPSGKEYADEANKWIETLKYAFPGVKIAVVGYASRENARDDGKPYTSRKMNWNRDVLSHIRNADAMTFHIYGGNGLGFIAHESIAGDDDEGKRKDGATVQQVFERAGSVTQVLGMPFQRWSTSLQYDYRILPEGMEVWITEYNMFEREGVVAGTWAHGMCVMLQTLQFMESPQTTHICYHNLTTTAQFAAVFSSDTAFHKSVRFKPNLKFGYSAAGHMLKITNELFAGSVKATKLRFSKEKNLISGRGKSYPSLYGWEFYHVTGKMTLLVINLDENPVEVDFAGLISGTAEYTMVFAGPRIQVAQESDLKFLRGTGKKILLKPYSVLRITSD